MFNALNNWTISSNININTVNNQAVKYSLVYRWCSVRQWGIKHCNRLIYIYAKNAQANWLELDLALSDHYPDLVTICIFNSNFKHCNPTPKCKHKHDKVIKNGTLHAEFGAWKMYKNFFEWQSDIEWSAGKPINLQMTMSERS